MTYQLMFALRFLILLTLTAFLAACGTGNGNDAGNAACTMEVRSSVDLSVLDSLGLPIRSFEAAFQINKGPVQKVSCASSDTCAIEYEKSGVFSMTVSKPGFNSTSLDATVTRDACHVMTRRVTLTLKAF